MTFDRGSIGYSLAFGLYGLVLAAVMWALESVWLAIMQHASAGTWIFWSGVMGRPVLIIQLQIILWTLAVIPGIIYAAAFYRKREAARQALEFFLLGAAIGLTYGIAFHLGQFTLDNLSYMTSGVWWRASLGEFLQRAAGMMLGDGILVAIWVTLGAFVCYIATRLGFVRWDGPAIKDSWVIITGLVAIIAIVPLIIAMLSL
ncbi:MAG: hypothetical protein A4E28_01434 [Methanocella sp. PtaU1.Bin125]|nr:MAG: hypothetical protein A4E28_01434 [Methanocella sp. PtaU1.Bin125]